MHAFHKWLFVLYFLINLGFVQDVGGNSNSRLATLAAMTEDHTFEISPYINKWTIDWSVNNEGKKFSNKAPGLTLVAFPLYYLWDTFFTRDAKTRTERDVKRVSMQKWNGHLLSIIFQVLPALFVAFLALQYMTAQKATFASQSFFLASFFFGSIFSLHSNTFFSHTWVGSLALFCYLLFQKRKYFLAGLALSFAILSDYSALFLLVAALPFFLNPHRKLLRFAVGCLPALALWIFYHEQCFGGVFRIALMYQNPIFLDVPSDVSNAFGVIQLFPKPSTAHGLIIGSERGLVWTQGWTLLGLTLGALYFKKQNDNEKVLYYFAAISFALLFYMNSCFGGWYGGATIGPRYLAWSLPILSLSTAFLLNRLPQTPKFLLGLSLTPALIFYCFAMGITVQLPKCNIFEVLWQWSTALPKFEWRLGLALFSLYLSSIFFFISQKKLKHQKG